MGNKMIAFLGADKYDILLYLSRILSRLNQKVLLVDYSENRALTYCIPTPQIRQEILMVRENSGIQMGHSCDCINYQGVDFLVEPKYSYLMKIKEKYDIILIDFGFQVYSKLLKECGQIYLCIDQQLHNIMQLKPIKQLGAEIESKCYLLFRQVYDCKISSMYLMEELDLEVAPERVFQYYQDSQDMKYCIDSQYNHSFQFAHISRGLKSCLLFVVRHLLPQVPEQQRKSAYRTARATSVPGRR